jgi:bifunctional DNA-binding transcriptional regulator/antitoxin component of YhaV-PrlF toxin-antitoxin module
MSDTKSIHKTVRFGTVAVQKLRRVVIPPHLAENMNIVEDDELAVFFDPDSKAAVLVKAEAVTQPAGKPMATIPSR